jgi:hypothetical protein
MLVVIGPGWIDARDASGARRLNNPNDFVRIEVETALNRNIRVIPVLVDGAQPFSEEDLPDALAPLARRQAIRLDHESFHVDVDRLADALSSIVLPANTTGTGLGTGTGDGTVPPVMSAKDLKDNVARSEASPAAPHTSTTQTVVSPRPKAKLGWFSPLAPALFAGLGWLYFFIVGFNPRYNDLRISRYGSYYFGRYSDGTSFVMDGEVFFASLAVAIPALWILFRLIRRRLSWKQFALIVILYAVLWFGAIVLFGETL